MPPSSSALPDPQAKAGDIDRRERLAVALAAARAGDRHGLDDLVRELTPILWHVARAHGLAQQDAVDVVQHSWLTLVDSLAAIRDPTSLLSWLITVTRREAWRVRAARRTELPVPSAELPEDEAPPADQRILTADQRRRLWAVMSRLSPRCQQLLRIVAFVERPDYQAVSAALGMPVGSIGPTRGRCLAKLRQLLDEDGEGGWPCTR